MAKSTLVFSILLLLSMQVMAQPYKSMFGKDSTEWVINWYNLDDFDNYSSIYVEKDTLVNGYTYKKLVIEYFTPSEYDGLFREDTITGKVWYRPVSPISAEDTAAMLAFDFNLEEGDSFDISNMALYPGPFYSTVDSVKYIDGVKHIYFNAEYEWAPNPSAYPSEPFTMIEGIGGNMGPLWKKEAGELRGQYLMCSYKDGERTSYENIRYERLCPTIWTGIPAQTFRPFKLILYPNPTSDYFRIKGLGKGEVKRLEIFDYMGRKVKVLENPQFDHRVDVIDFPAGLYLLRIDLSDHRHLYRHLTIYR